MSEPKSHTSAASSSSSSTSSQSAKVLNIEWDAYQRHSCKFCGRVFPGRVGLARHLRTHTGEKPFRCSVCNKAFKQKGSLTAHNRIHTGELPYQCDACHTFFRHKGNLQRHRRSCKVLRAKLAKQEVAAQTPLVAVLKANTVCLRATSLTQRLERPPSGVTRYQPRVIGLAPVTASSVRAGPSVGMSPNLKTELSAKGASSAVRTASSPAGVAGGVSPVGSSTASPMVSGVLPYSPSLNQWTLSPLFSMVNFAPQLGHNGTSPLVSMPGALSPAALAAFNAQVQLTRQLLAQQQSSQAQQRQQLSHSSPQQQPTDSELTRVPQQPQPTRPDIVASLLQRSPPTPSTPPQGQAFLSISPSSAFQVGLSPSACTAHEDANTSGQRLSKTVKSESLSIGHS